MSPDLPADALDRLIGRVNPRQDWEINEVPEFRIVEDALWQRVKARQRDATATTARDDSGNALNHVHVRRRRFLLSGLLTCGLCRGLYSIIGNDQYGCSTRRSKETCDNIRTIKHQAIGARVLDRLKASLITPELVELFGSTFHTEFNRLNSERSATRNANQQELGRANRDLGRLVDTITSGIDARTLRDRLGELEARA